MLSVDISTPIPTSPQPVTGWVFVVVIATGIFCGVLMAFGACALCRWRRRRMTKYREITDFFEPIPRMASSPSPLYKSLGSLSGSLSTFPELLQPNTDQLEPRLYETRDDNDNHVGGSPFMGPSRLCFSLNYSHYNEKLQVKLIRATRLTPKGNNVVATPYVKMCLLPDRKRKLQSTRRHRNSNPAFNEDFVFSVPAEELRMRTLKFTVCDFDRFSRQQVIGHVHFQLDCIDNLISPDGTGEIWVDINEDDAKVQLEKGQLLFSLQYLPTACRLTVAILKGKDLRVEGEETTEIDTYVKVSMIMGGKAVKKRKTPVVKKTCNPVFNQAFVFSMPPSYLENVSFVISVIATPKRGGNKIHVGRAVVGPYMYSTSPGLSHWTDMLGSPRSAVAQWHSLI
ncbi:synaptotagmin-C [Nematostella vectensis]|uniref:synaptotagmin-C n=1 Tax=Nematostella vectensis TaxID=45351 RepID=UPI0013900278|nr:synaptotagmin-C [Nematostella vectensis]